MTEQRTVLAGTYRTLPSRVVALARNLPQRFREREFWLIQLGIFGVTAAHILAELWTTQTTRDVPAAIHHIPVVLYLAPISYASLRYGSEGAVLTGLWSAALTVPNLLLWHRHDFEWLEIFYVAVVIAAGVIMAVPVEHERQQRRRAEATNQRLALLDDIATLTLTADLDTTLNETLHRLTGMLRLEAACVAVTGMEPDAGPVVLACWPASAASERALAACLRQHTTVPGADGPDPAGTVVVPVTADLPGSGPEGCVDGLLAVTADPTRPLSDADHRLLAGVASHLAVAIANERLSESERSRLRSYALLVTRAQEDERKRIARELHDEASQNVVVIRRSLAALAASFGGHPAAEELDELRALAAQTVAGMRRFSRDLRPPTLDELGLPSALEQLATQVQDRSDLAVDVRVEGRARRLPIETELAVFRVGQAAVHNVERHADATSASILLTFGRQEVRLVVDDDGCGFEVPRDLTRLPAGGQLGLLGMQERTQLVGGTLQLRSRPGAGTRVVLEVPG